MTKYELVFEKINDLYNDGALTLEEANSVNDLAYEKYVVEADEDSEENYDDDSDLGDDDGGKAKKISKENIAGIAVATAGVATIAASIVKFVRGNARYKKNLEDPELEKLVNDLKASKKELDNDCAKYRASYQVFDRLAEKYNKIAEVFGTLIIECEEYSYVPVEKIGSAGRKYTEKVKTLVYGKQAPNPNYDPAKAKEAANILEKLSDLGRECNSSLKKLQNTYNTCLKTQRNVKKILRMTKKKFEKNRDKLDNYKLNSEEYKKACAEHDAIIDKISSELSKIENEGIY